MNHRVKSLSLSFAVVAAMSATAAGAANASSFDVGANPAVITADELGQHVLTIVRKDGVSLNAKCGEASFEGTLQGQAPSEATVTPTFGGCSVSGIPTTVRMNGCKFTITGLEQAAFTAQVDVVACTAGKKVEVILTLPGGSKCTETIGEQNGLSHLVFENKAGPPKDIEVKTTLTGITTTQHGPPSPCPEPGVTGANFSISGTTTLQAYKDLGGKQVALHDHVYIEHLCGQQVEVVAT